VHADKPPVVTLSAARSGRSFGGWAALAFPEVDDRCGAIVALAPGGNSRPLPGIIPATLTFAWGRQIPTLYLVAEGDQYTPLTGRPRASLTRIISFVLGWLVAGRMMRLLQTMNTSRVAVTRTPRSRRVSETTWPSSTRIWRGS